MSPDADKFWEDLAPSLRRKQGFCPLTPEEAEAAFADANAEPLSNERIDNILESAICRDQPGWEPKGEEDLEGDAIPEGRYQMYRNQGENTPETDKAEEDLRRRMLGDDDPEEIAP